MPARPRTLPPEDVALLHQAALEILSETGVAFPDPAARRVFEDHSFKVEGDIVKIEPHQVAKALASAPSSFRIRARAPEKGLTIGGPDPVLAPTGGAPNIVGRDGVLRPATLSDYESLLKLVQTSPINGPVVDGVCFPQDVEPGGLHLETLYRDLTMTDRVLMANTTAAARTLDAMAMLEIVFGGGKALLAEPCSLNVINVRSPLAYAPDQSEVLMILAERGQPVAVTNMMMLGSTGPITVAGALAVGDAEILAGIVLAQLVRPGTPVLYGSTSCPMDMRTMVATLGAPETLWLSRGAMALADRHGLPCRTGGTLTDAHLPDAQAYIDGAPNLQNAIEGGAHYIFHAFGMLGSYLSASLEKFVLDEELALVLLAALVPPKVTPQALGLEAVKALGPNPGYLTRPETRKGFRALHRSRFLNRESHGQWVKKGLSALELAAAEVDRRLEAWERPPMDPAMERELKALVASRGNGT